MEATDTNDPTDRFLADIAEMRLKSAGRETALRRLGALLMSAGVALPVVAYFMSHNTDNALDQRDAIIIALIGIAVTIVGVGLFVRYSLADFFRFWLARLIYQQEVTAARAGAAPAPAAGSVERDAASPAVAATGGNRAQPDRS